MSGPPLHLPAYRAVAATLLLLSGCGEYGATAVAAPTLKWQLDAFGHNSARIRVAAPGQADVSEPITSGLLPVAPFFGNAGHGHDRTPGSVSWRDIGSSASNSTAHTDCGKYTDRPGCEDRSCTRHTMLRRCCCATADLVVLGNGHNGGTPRVRLGDRYLQW